ncbi:hypothetical protein [Streptomyces sp. NPDC058954]|uniref:hypothetical protein n=1 Tax=Streptomyces sp. NPDC058954 TaxID=3346677 RepID=UPI0036C7C1C5
MLSAHQEVKENPMGKEVRKVETNSAAAVVVLGAVLFLVLIRWGRVGIANGVVNVGIK